MKHLNEILQEFDGIQELPVSEETIGAYLEGKLAGADLRDVHNLLNSDDELYQFVDSLGDTNMVFDNLINLSQYGIEIPSALNSDNTKTSIGGYSDGINDNAFTLENDDSIFNIDFGQFDTMEHLDFLKDGHDSMIRYDLSDLGHLDNRDNEL